MPELSPTIVVMIVQTVAFVAFIIRLEGKVISNGKDLERLEAANDRCWSRVEDIDLRSTKHDAAIKDFYKTFNPDNSRDFWTLRGEQNERIKNLIEQMARIDSRLEKAEATYITHLQNAVNNAQGGNGNGCS